MVPALRRPSWQSICLSAIFSFFFSQKPYVFRHFFRARRLIRLFALTELLINNNKPICNHRSSWTVMVHRDPRALDANYHRRWVGEDVEGFIRDKHVVLFVGVLKKMGVFFYKFRLLKHVFQIHIFLSKHKISLINYFVRNKTCDSKSNLCNFDPHNGRVLDSLGQSYSYLFVLFTRARVSILADGFMSEPTLVVTTHSL